MKTNVPRVEYSNQISRANRVYCMEQLQEVPEHCLKHTKLELMENINNKRLIYVTAKWSNRISKGVLAKRC